MIMAAVFIILIVLVVVAAFVDLSGRWTDTIRKGREMWRDDKVGGRTAWGR